MKKKAVLPEMMLAPLDQIRHTETEVAGAIAAARQAAEQIVANAHAEATSLRHQAREEGIREGQARYKATVTQSEEQARVILDNAQHRAQELRRKGQKRMNGGVEYAVKIVLGLDEEEKLS
jgi:vacuolar-type H+-ATPase subunit H